MSTPYRCRITILYTQSGTASHKFPIYCNQLENSFFRTRKVAIFAADLRKSTSGFVMNNPNFSIFTLFLAVFSLFTTATVKASGPAADGEKFDAPSVIMHHIKDSHDWHMWGEETDTTHAVSIPLPVIVYSAQHGFEVFMSSAFHHDDEGKVLAKGKYLKYHGKIYLADAAGGLSYEDKFPNASDKAEEIDASATELGGNTTSPEVKQAKGTVYPSNEKPLDFSITRNVAALFISIALLFLVFVSTARSYDKLGVARGIGAFMEPLIIFIRDEVARPNIGEAKYARYMPYLLTVFFLIWINNLLGLIPFFPGGSNLTGNISFTMVLAVFTLLITSFSGNKEYWGHIFWMPGVPILIKPILAIVELAGVFIKPIALMIRLFANMAAGHILILALVCLIFILGSAWASLISVPFIVFMSCLELLVAVLQAYIFTLLSSLFIGMAVAEHDHGHEHRAEAHH